MEIENYTTARCTDRQSDLLQEIQVIVTRIRHRGLIDIYQTGNKRSATTGLKRMRSELLQMLRGKEADKYIRGVVEEIRKA